MAGADVIAIEIAETEEVTKARAEEQAREKENLAKWPVASLSSFLSVEIPVIDVALRDLHKVFSVGFFMFGSSLLRIEAPERAFGTVFAIEEV